MSSRIHISVACAEYDRTRAIKDGRVRIDGCDVTYLPLEPEELFFRAFRSHDFDVAELSLSSYLMTTTRGRCPYVAVPVFPSRHFRHSAIFIKTDRGIKGPKDLVGRKVGLPEYQQTANVWMRGIFKDDYGVDPASINWFTGGQDEPGRDERTPLSLTNGVKVQPIGAHQTLTRMLVDGELDAVFSARELSAWVKGAANIDLMFPDYKQVEIDYYKRTGHFPIMHLIGVKKDLVAQHPWLPGAVYKAFNQAKSLAIMELQEYAACKATLPWPEAAVAEAQKLMGTDFWRYGVKENARDIEKLISYSLDQGLIERSISLEELFHHSVFEVSRT